MRAGKEHVDVAQPDVDRGSAAVDVYGPAVDVARPDVATCVAHHGALVDDAWDKLCRLAALPEVRAIVPTWYE